MSASSKLPLLLDADELSLAPGFVVRHKAICDIQLAALHHLHGPGEHIAAALAHKITYGQLQTVAQSYKVSVASLRGLLYFLHTIGALQRKRALRQWLGACKLQATVLAAGTLSASRRKRYPPTIGGICRAVLRACRLLLATVCVTGILIAGTGSGSGTPAGILLAISMGLVVFVSSLVVHEYCHLLFIRRIGSRYGLLQYGLHIVLLHPQLAARQERSIAVAGPLGGVIWCSGAGGVALGTGPWYLAGMCALAAAFHMFSLLPWAADGKIVYSSGHSIRRGQS